VHAETGPTDRAQPSDRTWTWVPYSATVSIATIATAWPAAGYGALVIWTAGDFGSTGTLWLLGWPFLLQLLGGTTLHLLAMGLGAALGVPPLVPGVAELNRAVQRSERSEPIDRHTLAAALHAIVRMPVLNAALGGALSIVVTISCTLLEATVAGISSPNLWVIAHGGMLATALYVTASFWLGELLVRPCCRQLRRLAAAADIEPHDGFAFSRGWRIFLANTPVVVALLVAAEIGTSAHSNAAGYVVLILLTTLVTVALGRLQFENGNAAQREFIEACRGLAMGNETQLITGSLDGTLLRMTREFNAAARTVGADRRSVSEALQRSVRRLEELYRLAVVLSDEPAALAEHVVRALAELLEVPIASVETLDGDDVVFLAAMLDGKIQRGQRFALDGTPCADVRVHRTHCIFTDASERFPRDAWLREEGVRTYAGVPIIDGRDEVLGVINVLDRRARTFRDEDIQLLYTFAGRVASAFDRRRLTGEREALAARLAEQLTALRAAQERLVENDRVKTEFVGMMSHELRTPLNIFLGYTQMLLDAGGESAPITDPDRNEILKRMLFAGHTLSDLIEDTLSVLRLDAGAAHLSVEEVRLEPLFDELRAATRVLKQRDVVEEVWLVEPDVPALVTDRRKLRQVIANLVGNARKFTERGRIEVRATMDADDVVWLRVSDTGCGISADHMPFIFDLYRQAPNGQAHDGWGLGLYIVRRYVEMLHGRVACTSEPRGGTTFTVRLPRIVPGAERTDWRDGVLATRSSPQPVELADTR
jgi:signal transduction histidine kinase